MATVLKLQFSDVCKSSPCHRQLKILRLLSSTNSNPWTRPATVSSGSLGCGLAVSKDIRFETFHARKSSKPEYEALSCAWGTPTHTDVAVICEHVGFRGTRKAQRHLEELMVESIPTTNLGIAYNLAVALRHLKYPDKDRILWIDAICINQYDYGEKRREILWMGPIYNLARQSIVWLGPELDNSNLALQTLGRIRTGVQYDFPNNKMTIQDGSWTAELESNRNKLQEEVPSRVAISWLLRRSWFHRLWLFQEIVLATASTILVGEFSLDWELFRLGTFWLHTMTSKINLLSGISGIEFAQKSDLFGLLGETDRAKTMSLQLLSGLIMTKNWRCFDSRDRLYALRASWRAKEKAPANSRRLPTSDEQVLIACGKYNEAG
ncbi:uncharacterized protein RCO7_09749 [Rhynchosporium graminicola]|uniref:Heterokaryon incompatibility domain-containing protein n=1 Tax=Rhynchosporium graminicola TaxID=2792576 RepID=A0A1E1LA64_9HELO|nr:uncharacterized protein RCO7_09749 [Rhynchosporium commune]